MLYYNISINLFDVLPWTATDLYLASSTLSADNLDMI